MEEILTMKEIMITAMKNLQEKCPLRGAEKLQTITMELVIVGVVAHNMPTIQDGQDVPIVKRMDVIQINSDMRNDRL